MKSHNRAREGMASRRLRFEQLEDRANPAPIPVTGLSPLGPTSATFTDADGDTVTVRVAGTAGTAVFTNALNNQVVDGDDIANVVITGASADFTLTYSFDASVGGADAVAMGDITSNRLILGVYSVPLNNAGVPVGNFVLGSFTGPGLAAGGSVNADDVVGNGAGVGIDLTSLGAGRAINVRDDFDADVLIRSSLGGAINVGGDVGATAAWTVRGAVLPTGVLASVGGSFNGTVDVTGPFGGSATVLDNVTGTWLLRGTVQATARLLAAEWADVDARADWAGRINSINGDVTLDVARNVLARAVINSYSDVTLTVGGSVLSGASVTAFTDLVATVTGGASGHWAGFDLSLSAGGAVYSAELAAGGDLVVTAGRGVRGSQLAAAGDLTLDVGTGGVTSSVVAAHDDLTADIVGRVSGSVITSEFDTTIDVVGAVTDSSLGSGSDDLLLTVSGSVVRSTLFSQESDVTATIGGGLVQSVVIGGDGDDVNLVVVGNIDRSEISGPSDVTIDVGGSLLRSRVIADESGGVTIDVGRDVVSTTVTVIDSDLTMTVGRNMASSTLTVQGDITLTVGNDLSGTRVTSMDSDVLVNVTRDMTASVLTSASNDVTATVGRNVVNSVVTADNDVTLTVGGTLSGGLVAAIEDDLTITVGGTMAGTAAAGTNLIADLGGLTGSLEADNLDLAVTLNVGPTARIHAHDIDDLNGDTIGFKVGGTFAGTLEAVNLDSDEAGGSTLIGGGVLATGAINIGTLGLTADETFNFGGNFLGSLTIGGNVDVNLSFAGNVNRVIIGGAVGVTALPNTIFVGGRLTYLSSNSLFVATNAGFDGDFVDGAGVVTGNLDTVGGFVKVVPTA